MDYALQILLYGIAAVGCLWAVIAVAGALPLLKLADIKLVQLEPEEARPILQHVLARHFLDPQWLTDQDFAPRGVFRAPGQMGDPHFVAWQKRGERTYLCVYTVGPSRMEIDLVTVFEEGGLTTGTTKDGLTIPERPGHYAQAFSATDAATLWKHHKAGLEFLEQMAGRRPSRQDAGFAGDFVHNVRAHVAYVRSLPLWFLRMPYWYFIRRNMRYEKSVEEQYG